MNENEGEKFEVLEKIGRTLFRKLCDFKSNP